TDGGCLGRIDPHGAGAGYGDGRDDHGQKDGRSWREFDCVAFAGTYLEAERSVFFAGDWRSDVDEREPHAAAVAGAADGRVGRAHGLAEPEFVSELFADRGGAFANAGDATGAGDFAD